MSSEFASPFPRDVGFACFEYSSPEPTVSGEFENLAASLFPEERSCFKAMGSLKRRMQFTLGRLAAHQSLEQAGLKQPGPLARIGSGEAAWPSGFCGSIAHSGLTACACAASTIKYRGLGIDIQYAAQFAGSSVIRRIASADEQIWIDGSADPELSLAMLFSAKEAVYKALFRHNGAGLGFRDVEARWNEAKSALEFQIDPSAIQRRSWEWVARAGLTAVVRKNRFAVLTGVAL